jgi:hypothetical protein
MAKRRSSQFGPPPSTTAESRRLRFESPKPAASAPMAAPKQTQFGPPPSVAADDAVQQPDTAQPLPEAA